MSNVVKKLPPPLPLLSPKVSGSVTPSTPLPPLPAKNLPLPAKNSPLPVKNLPLPVKDLKNVPSPSVKKSKLSIPPKVSSPSSSLSAGGSKLSIPAKVSSLSPLSVKKIPEKIRVEIPEKIKAVEEPKQPKIPPPIRGTVVSVVPVTVHKGLLPLPKKVPSSRSESVPPVKTLIRIEIPKVVIPKFKKVEIYLEDQLIHTMNISKHGSLYYVTSTAHEMVANKVSEKDFLKLTPSLTLNENTVYEGSILRSPKYYSLKLFKYMPNDEKYAARFVYTKNLPNYQCIDSESLRRAGYMDLEKWMEDEDNVFIGKWGKIKSEDERGRTVLTRVKWGNPYQYDPLIPEEKERLYRLYLKENDLLKDIPELLGKTLGCYCSTSDTCHAKILHELIQAL